MLRTGPETVKSQYVLAIMVSQIMLIKYVHIPISSTQEYANFHGRRDPSDVIMFRIFRYPGLLGWAQCNVKGPFLQEKEGGGRVRENSEDALLWTLK